MAQENEKLITTGQQLEEKNNEIESKIEQIVQQLANREEEVTAL